MKNSEIPKTWTEDNIPYTTWNEHFAQKRILESVHTLATIIVIVGGSQFSAQAIHDSFAEVPFATRPVVASTALACNVSLSLLWGNRFSTCRQGTLSSVCCCVPLGTIECYFQGVPRSPKGPLCWLKLLKALLLLLLLVPGRGACDAIPNCCCCCGGGRDCCWGWYPPDMGACGGGLGDGAVMPKKSVAADDDDDM